MTQESLFEQAFSDELRSGIGGSRVGAIYNLDFGCKKAAWFDFRSVPQDFKKELTPELERGKLIEPIIRQLYEKNTGRKVKLMPMARSKQYPHMMVHVDGETTSPQHEGPGYAEFKCVNRHVLKRFEKDGLRESYILQIQHGMAVKGYQWGSFGILCLDPWKFAWFDVQRDEELIQRLIVDEEKFWIQVLNGPTPEALPEVKDKRCSGCPWRRTCRGEAMISGPDSAKGEGELVSDETLTPLVREVIETGELVAEASEMQEEAKNILKAAIGDRYGVIVPGYRAYYPTSMVERWDTKALEGLVRQAKELNGCEAWDLDQLQELNNRLMQIVKQLLKAKKPPVQQRSLRIYSTGD